MRNVFDQYHQPENRLTHAVLCSLDADRRLLRDFLRFIVPEARPVGKIHVLQQSLPGEPQDISGADEEEQRGLPDGWIHDDYGWSLLIESKVAATPDVGQVERHLRTAAARGFEQVSLLWLTVMPVRHRLAAGVINRTWSQLYAWLTNSRRQSDWAKRAAAYFEIAEVQADMKEQLQEGTLTRFAGIPFDREHPYSYLQAKRMLGLLMDKVRRRADLVRQLGMDPTHPGRGAITGRASTRVWDFLALRDLQGSRLFTQYIHLTASVTTTQLEAYITVPNGVPATLRKRLLGDDFDRFAEVIRATTDKLVKVIRAAPGAQPDVGVVQRRYPSQRAEPVHDATMHFDPRTAFEGYRRLDGKKVQYQPQWLRATYEALAHRKANLQLQIGVAFPYDRCKAVQDERIAATVGDVWLACKPFIAATRLA